MRLCILGDIHGNYLALNSVLKSIKEMGGSTLLIAGDFVGYYFWPAKVFDLLRGWDVVAIRGNHDRMFERAKSDPTFLRNLEERYGSGLRVALDELDSETADWLINLPNSLEYSTNEGKILLCHGSPWDGDEYVYPDASEESLARYADLAVRWVIQGHTHYPMRKDVGQVTVINPGSVGQPRDRNPGAQWAVLDTVSARVDYFCEHYDVREIISEARKRNPDIPYLANVFVTSE